MILEKMMSCLWKMEPGFWIYGWICYLGTSGPNVVSRPQACRSKNFLRFHDFVGLISKLEPMFWFLNNGLISPLPKALGPNCPKLVFRPQTPNVRVLRSVNFFMSSSIKFCFKYALIFQFWVIFDKVMSVYSQKIAKNPSKIVFLVPFQICKFPLSLV